ncbi:MAG: hypothetical protein QOD37_1123 [Gaiellales bacterium]|nr:hypothetical protein [Gaiellales bacterium]
MARFELAVRVRCGLAIFAACAGLLFCGAQPAAAIVGGQAATPGYFGYVTFVGAAVGDGTAYYCTGALVAPSVVLTAAHCAVLLPASSFSVGTGRLNLYDSSTGQVLGVSSVAISPTWDRASYLGDVALLQLSQPSTAPTLPVATADEASWVYRTGAPLVVAGWGRTVATGPGANDLNWVGMSVQEDGFCRRSFNGASPAYDASSMFCASVPGSAAGACYGDSGGPAVGQSQGGTYEIVGVASLIFLQNCAPPDVFSRVSYNSPWLANEIALLQATAPPPLAPVVTAPAPLLLPRPAPPVRKRPTLKTRVSAGVRGRFAKLRFLPGSQSGQQVRVRLRVFSRGALLYAKTTQYFTPTARAMFLSWLVPPRLRHAVRFCMSATLYASSLSSKTSCSTFRVEPGP